MRTLYLECATGVSGDMLLGALAGAADDPLLLIVELQNLLDSLAIEGLSVGLEKRIISSISTWKAVLGLPDGQPLRTIADIEDILSGNGVSAQARPSLVEAAMTTLRVLAEAEASVHGMPVDQVHFHEIGALDTIVDVLGAHFLARRLGCDRCLASPVNLGSGFVSFSHGCFPVPAPASAELARGMEVFGSDAGMETATPTGLALVKTLAQGYGPLPAGRLLSVGYGCGDKSSDRQPTFVRAYVLEQISAQDQEPQT